MNILLEIGLLKFKCFLDVLLQQFARLLLCLLTEQITIARVKHISAAHSFAPLAGGG